MTLPIPNTHDVVTAIGAVTITAFAFIYPDKSSVLWEIAGAYGLINGGQMLGNLGQGGKRWMQGGAEAPSTINPPPTEVKQ
jgi:hypothetical protein